MSGAQRLTPDATPDPVAPPSPLPLWLRLAWRDLRTGLPSFSVFIGCIALGVMVITGVGALSDALRAGLAKQGRSLLGGDLTFARVHARATEAERARLSSIGALSETATLRTMARTPDGSEQALAELKAIDAAYPLVGAVALDGAPDLATAVMGGDTAAVEPLLLERLGLKVGDQLTIGEAKLTVTAKLTSEPDGIGDRSSFGPRVLVSAATLEKTKLIQPGTLVRWRYAVTVPDAEGSPEALKRAREAFKRDQPESGFTFANRTDPSPQLTRTIERLRQFLTLIGLTSLIVGGVGVANAVSTFIDKRRKVIATMKSLGAPNGLIFRVFLAQILAVTALGILIGLILGYLVPIAAVAAFGAQLPIEPAFSVQPLSVANAVLYGLLVALVFTLWPLGRAERVSPSVLFRDDVSGDATRPAWRIISASVAAGLALVAFTVLSSDAPLVALSFCAAMAVIFAVFAVAGRMVPRLAGRIPRPRVPELALALGGIAAPGGLASSVLLSLGMGLSLLVGVALVDSSLQNELTGRLPEAAPSYFILDVGKSDLAPLSALVEKEAPGSRVDTAPMLRGRLVSLKGVPVERIKTAPEAAWVLTGDRGLSFSAAVPTGSTVVAGDWWPKDYAGEPLVSFEAELAKKLGLSLGDSVTVNVLGRDLTAKISSLREVKWDSLALNFVMVYSPNALQSAPYKLLATIMLPKDTPPAAEVALSKAMGRALPAITPVRVKDAIEQFNVILGKVLTAVRVAGGVTLAAGALVLAGALATAQRRRILDAVILKALGVTRRRILVAHVLEYGLLALVAAVFALGLGSLAAYLVVHYVMSVPFAFSGAAVAQALGVAMALVAAFGGIGTASVLRAPAVPYLKSE
jgi:putative ABC transport system permease protein